MLGLLLAACQSAGPPDAHAPGQSSETLLRVADDTAAGGDLGTAAGLYRRAAELTPEDPRPLAKLGAVLLQLHAYTEAAATYRAALKISPNPIEAELHRGLAVVLLALDQPQAALTELDAAGAKAPQDVRLYNALGVAHDLLGRHDLAQQDYRNGLRLAPDNAGLRNNYALSLALSRDYPAAVAALSGLADRADASPRHRLNLALIYGLAGDDKKAAALARTTLDEAAVANNLAYYAMLRGMDDKARANAIMGSPGRGPALAEASAKSATPAEAPVAAAPTEPVTAAPLADAEKPQPKAVPVHRAKPAPAPTVAPAPPADAPAPAATPQPAAEVAAAVPQPAEPPAPADAAVNAAKPAPVAEPKASAAAAPAEQQAAAPQPAPAEPPSAPAVPHAAPPQPAEAPAAPTEHATAEPPPMAQPAGEADPVAAKPATGGTVDFVLQLGAFAVELNAHRLAEQLNQKGYETVVVHRRDHDGRDWFIVRAGGYASAGEAAAAARHIRDAEQVPAVVVHLHQPNQA